jgi:uncharacterized protein (UPF0333 family)
VTKVKGSQVIASLVVLSVFLASMCLAYASPTQKRFSLAYFDVDVSYPQNGKPGESVTISATATANKDCEVQDLSIDLFAYSVTGDPRLIGSVSIIKQTTVTSGNSFQKYATITIPSDVPRSFLMAVASESIRTYSYSYSYSYSYWYPYSWYSHDTTRYWWWWYPTYYSYRTYVDTVDKDTGPLTYVLATTPEYTQLKTDYDKLSIDYDKLSSDYSALNERYARLNQEQQALLTERGDLLQTLSITRAALYCLVVAVLVAVTLLYIQRNARTVVNTQPQTRKKTPASPPRK